MCFRSTGLQFLSEALDNFVPGGCDRIASVREEHSSKIGIILRRFAGLSCDTNKNDFFDVAQF